MMATIDMNVVNFWRSSASFTSVFSFEKTDFSKEEEEGISSKQLAYREKGRPRPSSQR
jgi:hypothetical protein